MDYELANADLAALVQGQEVDVSSISVEDSKFLGGDVEHTHLVKGLDYALLNKVGVLAGEQRVGQLDGSGAHRLRMQAMSALSLECIGGWIRCP